MHAAGAAGAIVAITDCSSNGNTTVFYGAACVDGSCITVTDAGAGADAYDANTTVFYGAACPDGSCLPPVEAGGDGQPDAAGDASTDAGDARSTDAPTDSNGSD